MKYVEKMGPLFQQFVGGGVNVPLLRVIVGSLGMALPIVLMVWGFFLLNGWHLQNSLSDYYSLRTRDAFVGILFVIGWFLFAYKGYEKMDSIAGKLACLFAMGVALFPNSGSGWERIVHFSCATCMFLILAFFSLVLFTKSKGSPKGFKRTISTLRFRAPKRRGTLKPEKKMRNTVYIVCGIVIMVCIVLVGLYTALWQQNVIKDIKPVFWLESIMIWAFGVSWFIKGETLLKDKKT
jgi:hypothetical protein